MNEILIGILGAILGSVATHFLQQYTDKQNKQKKKILTNEIITALSPEKNYKKAEELLGLPDKIFEDFSEIEKNNEEYKFESSLYFLTNAYLKITTIDKQSIHAISVLSYDNNLILPFFDENIHQNSLGKTKINQEMIDNKFVEVIHSFTVRESVIILKQNIGAPFYKTMSYFCDGSPSETINDLLDRPISGFCLSNFDDIFYIHNYDLR